MSYARKTLAIVALAAMVGCTVKSPAISPLTTRPTLQLYSTEATSRLILDLARRYSAQHDHITLDVRQRTFDSLMAQLDNGEIDYLVSNYVPIRADIWAAPLALDGLAIIVNRSNDISSLSVSELRALYGGRHRDWRAFDAEATEIRPLSFQAGSDFYHEFKRMVMGVHSITGNALLVPSFEAMLQVVSESAGAIGYLPLSRVDNRVKVLAIDGIQPTAASIDDRRYPLRSTVYVIGREAPTASTFHFFGWVQSEDGQMAVSESHSALP